MTVSPSTSPFTPITRNPRVNSPKARKAVPATRLSKSKQRRYNTPSSSNSASKKKAVNRGTPVTKTTDPETVNTTPCSVPRDPEPIEQVDPASCSVAILDWDDTLLASTYLASLGYRLEVEQEFPPGLRSDLDILQDQIITILESLINIVGAENLVIITNAERGWVELSAKKFIPAVLPTLEKCHIVSARSTFEITGSGPMEWKLLAFYHKIQQSFGFRIPPPALNPRSPYVGYLQRLYETGNQVEPESNIGQLPEPPCSLDRDVAHYELPDLGTPGSPNDVESEGSEDGTSQNDDYVLAGGGTRSSREDKENVSIEVKSPEKPRENSSSRGSAPRAMLLDEQNAYDRHKEDDSLIESSSDSYSSPEEEELPSDTVPPYHLHDSGLLFKLAEDHEKIALSRKYVVSFGDSLAEKHAARGVWRNMPCTTLKTIKFQERPSLAQLSRQLTVMEQYLEYIMRCSGPLDIVLNPQAAPQHYDPAQ